MEKKEELGMKAPGYVTNKGEELNLAKMSFWQESCVFFFLSLWFSISFTHTHTLFKVLYYMF